ncbi:MAG: hypothetical protein ACM3PC_08540 [Deltaproteobacteria bacterium]
MARLSWKQVLVAIALGAIFATLQGDPPVPALRNLALVCSPQATEHC